MRGRGCIGLVFLLLCGCAQPEPRAQSTDSNLRWWKGNLHNHSLWSDGDDFPEMVVDWYGSRDYQFMALSDHNVLADSERWIAVGPDVSEPVLVAYRERFGPEWVEQRDDDATQMVRLKTLEEYRSLFEEPGTFLLMQSEEISDHFEAKPIHVNATNVRELIPAQGGASVREVMQNTVNAVLEQRERTGQKMFPHINHPNYGWAVKVEDLMALQGEKFFEVYNGHPAVNNEGNASRPSTERMWDILLAERLMEGEEIMYGLAVDDAHFYHEMTSTLPNPGRGWVMVRAAALEPDALIDAMEAGDFYGSSGVLLDDIRVTDGALELDIEAEPGVEYRTQFIGTRRGYDRSTEEIEGEDDGGAFLLHRYSDSIGEVLSEVEGVTPSYRFEGDEIYVRAKVVSSKAKENPYSQGEHEAAWIQPVQISP